MGQRPAHQPRFFLASCFTAIGLAVAACLATNLSCDKGSNSSWPASSVRQPGSVASLVPAATEMLIGMGGADHLVAVSNFDTPRDGTRNLPRVGDYQTTDWERLAALRPESMITQFAPSRLPPGLVQKSNELGIKLVNVRIDRLEDIYATMVTLGQAIGDAPRGQAAADALRLKLDDIAAHSKGRPVRALIVLDEGAHGVAGRNNYLDDVLTIAGGVNVIPAGSSAYPSIDREALADLDPEVIFHLLTNASPQVRAAVGQLWQSMPQLQAVRNGRVHITNAWWNQLPTQHVSELGELLSKAMNEDRAATTGRSATNQAATTTRRVAP